jgi:C-terminal processing protease CtpA/Prc
MKKLVTLSAILLSLLSGCGGGGGNPGTCLGSDAVCHPSSTNTDSSSGSSTAATSTIGTPSALANICTPDGEKQWVRAHLDDVYLWYNEIVDVDRSKYSTAEDYFYALLVRSHDRFSFTESQDTIDKFFQSGEEVGYGMELVLVNNHLRVAYVEPNTSAAEQGVARGADIIGINGTPIGNLSRDTQIAALYPSTAGMVNQFTIVDAGAHASRTVVLTAGAVTHTPVLQSRVLTAGGRRIGYMVFNDHIATAEGPLVAAFTQFQQSGIDDLVLDLRYNGGGYLYIASEVATMIGGGSLLGQTFEQLRFNNKHPEKTNDPNNKIPFYLSGTQSQLLPQLNMQRVFVLTGNGTCSASESIINGLSPFVQVITIGSTTCGKPYGMIQTNNCSQAYFAIQFEGVNSLGQGGYSNGIAPNCPASDDLDHQLGDTNERVLSTAISYAVGGSCPATSFTQGLTANYAPLSAQPFHRVPWRENRLRK